MRRKLVGLVVVVLAAATLAGQSPRERLLFDGKTTNGWRGFKKAAFPDRGWVVQDGWIKHLAKNGQDSGGKTPASR